jgi:cell division protein ZapA (FtsZ GTPase activity inhibitor)
LPYHGAVSIRTSPIRIERSPHTIGAVQRIWDALTVKRLAGLLVGLAGVAIFIDVRYRALDAWMPAVAMSAITIAVTITVVDNLIRREERARSARRRLQANRRLYVALVSLTQAVLADYVGTHLHSDIEMSGDPAELLRRWREDDVDLLGLSHRKERVRLFSTQRSSLRLRSSELPTRNAMFCLTISSQP